MGSFSLTMVPNPPVPFDFCERYCNWSISRLGYFWIPVPPNKGWKSNIVLLFLILSYPYVLILLKLTILYLKYDLWNGAILTPKYEISLPPNLWVYSMLKSFFVATSSLVNSPFAIWLYYFFFVCKPDKINIGIARATGIPHMYPINYPSFENYGTSYPDEPSGLWR